MGVTEIAMGTDTVPVADALFVESACEVAVTVQLPTVAGAVNVTGLDEVLESVPQLAVHLTAVFVDPLTVAVIALV